MAAYRPPATQLRDRLLSHSPDPIKSSILRESNMGWSSPPTSSDNTAASSATSPLRISKRESSPNLRPTQADLARRSSSSYKHMRNNNLVSKSPFKSQIPTPSTPSRQPPLPVSFPTRRVSGEKRQRPPSMHEQAENENDRPFSLKRDRKQSKTFQGLVEKEPVTKSPFRQVQARSGSQSSLAMDTVPDKPLPPIVPATSRIPVQTGNSPARPSLVTKRMHGPRLSGAKRERRKTVTFHEDCEVLEFDRDEDMSGEVFESDDEEDEYGPEDDGDVDSFFENPRVAPPVPNEGPDDSYESIELSDQGDEHLELNPDTSITGLVDEMFAGSRQTSTPPRQPHADLPDDLETEDGIPLGRSHHAERAMKHRQEHQTHPDSNPHVDPAPLPTPHTPHFPIPAIASSPPPSTPPHRTPIHSPPLGRSTHFERLQSARKEEEEIDRDVRMLPESPSPMKPSRARTDSPAGDGLIPKFELPGNTSVRSDHGTGPDPFAMPHLKDEPLPSGSGSFIQENSMMSTTSTEHSEVNISALEQNLGNERLINTSMEASLIDHEASFTRASSPAPVRRSPLPPIPSAVPQRLSSPVMRSPSPSSQSNSPVTSPNGARPRLPRDGLHRRLLRPRSVGSMSPSPSGSPRASDAVLRARTSLDQQRVVDLSVERDNDNDDGDPLMTEDVSDEKEIEKDAASVMTAMTDNSAEMATIEMAEKRKLVAVGVVQQHEPAETEVSMEVTHDVTMDLEEDMRNFRERQAVEHHDVAEPIEATKAEQLYPHDESFESDDQEDSRMDEGAQEEFGMRPPPSSRHDKLKFDLGSKFGQGKLGFSGLGFSTEDLNISASDDHKANTSQSAATNPPVDELVQRMPVGPVKVPMDMRSALDRLMDDVAGAGGNTMEAQDSSMVTTEDGDESDDDPLRNGQPIRRAATDSAVSGVGMGAHPGATHAMPSRSSSSSSSVLPPPVPPKDNIGAREAMILEKRRERRRMEEGIFENDDGDAFGGHQRTATAQLPVPTGRPSRRRSMSTGDADDMGGGARRRGAALTGQDSKLLDVETSPVGSDDPLSDTIEKELNKKVDVPKKQKKYFIREHQGTIYASSDVSHMAGPGDVNTGKAWRTVRRPSDMNEYSKQIKEFRAQEKPGKAYGKVFVKVLGAKGLLVPMPGEPTLVSCTLNNGIHFVETPYVRLGKDCRVDQEFELIEHSKLEFTLTLKVRRDPHIISQFKAVVPPVPQPPPMVSNPSSTSTTKSSGMRSFFSSSPKKHHKDKAKRQNTQPPPPVMPQLPPPRLTENLARYLKADGTLARAFVSFKDISTRCDTKLFETTFPLIGQRAELGSKSSPVQVGELVLQVFRLPPLPGLPPKELPQSLEECHRGLRHVNWHKMTYFEGTLTQNGGDCSSWRRRQLRVIGSNLVAFNDVTKRVTATISLKNAISVEDNQDPHHQGVRSPASGASRYDEYDGLFGVERSFRLVFPTEEILFFADTDEEKAKWLEVLRALVGHIPPHPLWAELLWQKQEDLNKARNAQARA